MKPKLTGESENNSLQSNSYAPPQQHQHLLTQSRGHQYSNGSLDLQSVSSLKFVSALAPSTDAKQNMQSTPYHATNSQADSRADSVGKESKQTSQLDEVLSSKGPGSLQYLSYLSQNVGQQTKLRTIEN